MFFCLFYNLNIFICKDNVNMKKEIEHDKLLNIRMSGKLIENYKSYCEENGLLLSKRIRFLIQKDIEGKVKIDK